ncbi:uncharacterized protein DFL_001230 [Arthrobotrys flagrans]|uniref:Uncharacterized protein n=1 Tax=Arthrobotrys flagrans TaxID=97331 RepID=A0A437AGI0_ARTFL|nr:hypothetical protein DFL_001230 [Arthrobotrys flagrans]
MAASPDNSTAVYVSQASNIEAQNIIRPENRLGRRFRGSYSLQGRLEQGTEAMFSASYPIGGPWTASYSRDGKFVVLAHESGILPRNHQFSIKAKQNGLRRSGVDGNGGEVSVSNRYIVPRETGTNHDESPFLYFYDNRLWFGSHRILRMPHPYEARRYDCTTDGLVVAGRSDEKVYSLSLDLYRPGLSGKPNAYREVEP